MGKRVILGFQEFQAQMPHYGLTASLEP
jgi:hypothetical protein